MIASTALKRRQNNPADVRIITLKTTRCVQDTPVIDLCLNVTCDPHTASA
jgi:hypothetical protein